MMVLDALHLVAFLLIANNCITSTMTLKSTPSNSILDIINMKEVKRLIEQQENSTKEENNKFIIGNDLHETHYPPEPEYEIQPMYNQGKSRVDINTLAKRNYSDHYYREMLEHLKSPDKMLKSSKSAVLITKKEYLKKEWCKTEHLIQKIKEKGCLTRTVINKFCYGQCNSFYIPKNPRRRSRRRQIVEETEDEDINGPAFKYCGFCKPHKYTWVTITLKCPSSIPPIKKKRVQRIKHCQCLAADSN